jgi:hypothetical protein
MHLAGFRMATLNDLGSTRYFDWSPPFLEETLEDMADGVFVHPVLDTRRFLLNVKTWMVPPEAFFDPENPLRQRIVGDAYKTYLPQAHGQMWTSGRTDLASRAVDLMRNVGDQSYLERHGLTEENLALGKIASQSSLSDFSIGDNEASGALTGPVSGQHKFHTNEEMRPWWMVDLRRREFVDEVRVHNRHGQSDRAEGLEMHVSPDGRAWEIGGVHEPGVLFGDPLGTAWVVPVGREIRFVRLELPRVGVLHLDQVHVIRHGRLRPGTGFERGVC